jgi:hypothetical protein
MPLSCHDGRMRALDWNALQFVLALARHGALGRAAEGLGETRKVLEVLALRRHQY